LDEKHTVDYSLASYWKVATEKRSSANRNRLPEFSLSILVRAASGNCAALFI